MSDTDDQNGWPEYAKLVLAELKRHDGWLCNLDRQINNHINHIEHRLTEIETVTSNLNEFIDATISLRTTIRNFKWITGIMIGGLVSVFIMLLSILIGG